MRDIYKYIKTEADDFKTKLVPITENWEWNMWKHLNISTLYKYSKFSTTGPDRPNKNITLPILRLQYRTEGFDVKDVELFVNELKNYYKSLLARKFYQKYARDNKIDDLIDQTVESFVDYGGALLKKGKDAIPEVVPLTTIAFCDQTDIMSGPICIEHFYTPVQLEAMAKFGWKNIDQVLLNCQNTKETVANGTGISAKTTGKFIKIYELHGEFEKEWLNDGDAEYESKADEKYVDQLNIVALYQNENNEDVGITLYHGKEKREDVFKFIARDKINGRALGWGGAEELFEPQVWTNYDIIRMNDMLDAASKIIIKTDDPALETRHPTGLKGLDNLDIITVGEGKTVGQMDTYPRNLALFEKSIQEWEVHAQQLGSATDALMGVSPTAGTPFKLQELVTQTSQGDHDYRQGKLARFMGEVHTDWIIPDIAKKISEDSEFLSELDTDELQQVVNGVINSVANKYIKEAILNGEDIDEEKKQALKDRAKEEFKKKGNKHFIKIFKDEMKKAPLQIYVNIAGKQKDINKMTDKISNVFKFIFSTYDPNTKTFAFQSSPAMVKLLNQLVNYSGLNQIDFNDTIAPEIMAPASPPGQMPAVPGMPVLK